MQFSKNGTHPTLAQPCVNWGHGWILKHKALMQRVASVCTLYKEASQWFNPSPSRPFSFSLSRSHTHARAHARVHQLEDSHSHYGWQHGQTPGSLSESDSPLVHQRRSLQYLAMLGVGVISCVPGSWVCKIGPFIALQRINPIILFPSVPFASLKSASRNDALPPLVTKKKKKKGKPCTAVFHRWEICQAVWFPEHFPLLLLSFCFVSIAPRVPVMGMSIYNEAFLCKHAQNQISSSARKTCRAGGLAARAPCVSDLSRSL